MFVLGNQVANSEGMEAMALPFFNMKSANLIAKMISVFLVDKRVANHLWNERNPN